MLKMALFDCAINEKCCSVDGGRGICQLKSPHPRESNLPYKAKKCQCPGGGGGGEWVQRELTDRDILKKTSEYRILI